ncbi:MAG: SAM-dependent DNA methyltransferase, partial [Spirochaetaceae bacterium]|nr:SAM-dependent DNA methyltransferase [Spirochaetaceae bacterium]
MARRRTTRKKDTAANLGFEEKLWLAADKLRGNLDAAEYKHVALGLIFLKYISDAFEERHGFLKAEAARKGSDWYVKDAGQLKDVLEDRDAYRMKSVFFVPPEARWEYLQSRAKDPKIGRLIDSAMDSLERDNASLKGVLPKVFAREAIDKRRLGELIDLIGTIGLGDKESRTKDVLGRVYEYFLAEFASAEGKKGGQFYT